MTLNAFSRILATNLLIASFTPFIHSEQSTEDVITIPFAVGAYCPLDHLKGFFFGAATAGTAEKALTILHESGIVQGIVPEVATIEHSTEKVANPLFNEPVEHVACISMGISPLIVTKKDPSIVYMIDNYYSAAATSIIRSSPIIDVNGKKAEKICKVTTGEDNKIFAAIVGAEGTHFGDTGSGIALLMPYQQENENKVKQNYIGQVIHQLVEDQEKTDKKKNGNQSQLADRVVKKQTFAYACQYDSPHLMIGKPLSSIARINDMCWSQTLQCLFIALDATAADDQESGAYGVAVARLVDKKRLEFSPIIAPKSVSSDKKISVATKGNCARVSIDAVAIMCSSTLHHYLITCSNNDGVSTVCSYPLVTHFDRAGHPQTQEDVHGTIACFDDPHTSPLTSDDIPHDGLPSCQVGGAGILPGTISSMNVVLDTVFVSIKESGSGLPGIFSSQALFDHQGNISSWTDWQRVAGITNPVDFFTVELPQMTIRYLTMHDDYTQVRTVSWQKNSENNSLAKTITDAYQPDGVLSIRDFPIVYKGLGNSSIMGITGKSMFSLVTTGIMRDGQLEPITSYAQENLVTAGQTRTVPGYPLIFHSKKNPALEKLGHITSLEIATCGNQSYLVIGGMGGLAIMSHNDGSGWDTNAGLSPDLSELFSMDCHLIGSYRLVKKILCDNQMLYVLTDKKLDRIDLNEIDIVSGTIKSITLADEKTFRARMFDLLVSEKVALLATSSGLYRTGNQSSVRDAACAYDMKWTKVPLAEAVDPIVHLLPVTKSLCPTDIARSSGGYVYAIGSYVGASKTTVHRISVKGVDSNPIDDQTVQEIVLSDGSRHPFKTFNSLKNTLLTNGSTFIFAPGKTGNIASHYTLTQAVRENHGRSAFTTKKIILVDQLFPGQITSMALNSGTGQIVIGGQFGLVINY